jgi:hypothetical protein
MAAAEGEREKQKGRKKVNGGGRDGLPNEKP